MSLPLSITTGSFFPEPTIHAIERIHRLGFSSFELTIQESDMDYEFSGTRGKDFFQRILRLTRRLNLRASTVHAPYLSAVQMFSEKIRAEIIYKALEGASFLESELLIIHPYHIFSSYEKAISFLNGKLSLERALLLGFKTILHKAEKENVIVAIENIAHWKDSPLLNSPNNMLRLVKSMNSESVKADLNLFHSEVGECTNRFLHKLNLLIVSTHVSDTPDHGPRTLPGKGKLDWNRICERLKALPSLRHVVIEITGRVRSEEVRQSAHFLNRLLASKGPGSSRTHGFSASHDVLER